MKSIAQSKLISLYLVNFIRIKLVYILHFGDLWRPNCQHKSYVYFPYLCSENSQNLEKVKKKS